MKRRKAVEIFPIIQILQAILRGRLRIELGSFIIKTLLIVKVFLKYALFHF